MTLDSLLHFLDTYQSLMLVILFLGAYLETLIVTSFFVYGELFFLASGILAGVGGVNLWVVTTVLFIGGLLGDHTSYWMGRKWGVSLYQHLQRWAVFSRYFTEENYTRGAAFFKKYGGWSVFVGRFLGPVSWITPFFAGIFKLSYRRFTLFDTPGVILGIGQFILLGYLFGTNYQTVKTVFQQYLLSIVFVIIVLVTLLYFYRRQLRFLNMEVRQSVLHYITALRKGSRAVYIKTVKITTIAVLAITILYLLFLFGLFFTRLHQQQQNIPPDLNTTFQNIQEVISSIDSTTYYPSGTQDVEPINLILVGTSSPSRLITDAGWNQRQSIIRNQITIMEYLAQAKDKLLPVSDLYFKGVPQNMSFEYGTSTSLSDREHVRVWHYGTLPAGVQVYLGSASNGVGFDTYLNRSFVVLLHEIDPDVDASRRLFVETISAVSPVKHQTVTAQLPAVTKTTQEQDELLYFTDGNISVIHY